jgi:predicted amino acid racemase
LTISLEKIEYNLKTLLRWYGEKNIQLTAVIKGVCASPEIAELFANHAIHSIGDSHMMGIRKMKAAGIDAAFMLLRPPMQHELEDVVNDADFSLHSEISTITRLNALAGEHHKKVNIILMIELGDLREGILPAQVDEYIERILALENIHLAGIGANLVCLNGIRPTATNMGKLSSIAEKIEEKFNLNLDIISGGNSANYQWFRESDEVGRVNHLRIGESILFGTDPIAKAKIDGLKGNAFQLSVEVIESKRKASLPEGIPTYTAFGDKPRLKDEGEMNRAVLGIGLQDLDIKGCKPAEKGIRVMGATSDHMVIASRDRLLQVGEVVQFDLTYRAVLRLMISPYVQKEYY